MKSLKDCDYSAFISYAHADDHLEFGWVSHFRKELERGLAAALRGVKLPPVHLSAHNGPVAGPLADELSQRVARSFAMVIVVHENYVQSPWCLKELEYFRQHFGDAGVRERLYVLALSEPAVQQVCASPAWKRLLPGGDQVWMPFFDETEQGQAVPIYMGPELVTPRFREQFVRLRRDFSEKLRQSAAEDRTPIVQTALAAHAGAGAAPPEPGPSPAARPPRVLLGFGAGPASAAALEVAAQRLRAQGVAEVRTLAPDAVFNDFAAFADAEVLVLAVDDAPLTLTALAVGGHLQVQREAWLKRGRPAQSLRWLDLRSTAAAAAATPGAAYAATLGATLLDLPALAQQLAPAGAAAAGAAAPQDVRIYIESNRNELDLWQPLGAQMRRRWDKLAAGTPQAGSTLALRTRGLPVDQIDAYPSLDDADGVVLLWGRKTADALVAQINKVENKMSPGRDAAPGVVAYLMPPQAAGESVPAWGWQVLRFKADPQDEIDVVAEEGPGLEAFLKRVLQRRLQRTAGAAGAPA